MFVMATGLVTEKQYRKKNWTKPVVFIIICSQNKLISNTNADAILGHIIDGHIIYNTVLLKYNISTCVPNAFC